MIRPANSLARPVGRLIMAGLPGLDLDAKTAALLREGTVGSICLFSRNVQTPEQTLTLCDAIRRAAGRPIFIAADLEGGYVWRLRPPAVHFPSAMALGAAGDPSLTTRVAAALGTEMRSHGIDLDLAPVVDVNNNPANPVIATRSFGERPEHVANHGAAFVHGLHQAGAAACAKHFPGHGDTSLDSHLALPSIPHDLARLRRVELAPFRAAIDAGIDAIMTAHVVFPALDADVPATLSRRILHGLLRQELGFQGLIVSDAMGMQAIAERWGTVRGCALSIAAGADVVCSVNEASDTEAVHAALLEAVESGEIDQAHVMAASARVDALAKRLSSAKRPGLDVVGSDSHQSVVREAMAQAVTLVRGSGGAVRPAAKVGVIELYSGPATGAEDTRGLHGRLAETLRAHRPNVRELLVDLGAVDEAAPGARALAAQSDSLVVATRNAWRREDALALVRELCEASRDCWLVALRDPYDVAHVPEAKAALCAYCDVPAAIEAVADVLVGAPAPGKLPVSLV